MNIATTVIFIAELHKNHVCESRRAQRTESPYPWKIVQSRRRTAPIDVRKT